MSDLIQEINYTVWKNLKPEELRQLKSCEITFNGEYLFTFANGNIEPSGYFRVQTEYNAQTANAVGGKTLEQILEERHAPLRV